MNVAQVTTPSFRNVCTDYAITSRGGTLGSTGAAGCLIIAIHDAQNGHGCMAHLSPGVPEGPVLVSLTQFLVQHGGVAANFGVLLAGGAGREATPGWHANFLGDLAAAGLAAANVHDCRMAAGGKTVIGNNSGTWNQAKFDPVTGNVEQILVTAPGVQANTALTTEYTVNVLGTLTAVAAPGQCHCIIL